MPTPAKVAAINLTDYLGSIGSRVVTAFEATPSLKAGTRQWRALLLNADRDVCDENQWRDNRSDAVADMIELLDQREEFFELAEAEEQRFGV